MDTRTATSATSRGEPADDLSALAWVHDELRRTLEAAHKSMRRCLKEAESLGASDVDTVDPAVLRSARSQLHQGVGALELVGLPEAALVLRSSEALVQKFVAKPHKLTASIVEDIEKASFALLDYLARRLAGKPVAALSMFPQYRAVQEAAGAERIHPADLWNVDWQWRELPSDTSVPPRALDAATRSAMEGHLLGIMRTPQPTLAAARMSEGCAGLGAAARDAQAATLWKLASAVFEAQGQGLLGFDVFSKRVASRLLAQYRVLERGDNEVSERLAQDLLFFCAQSASPGDGRRAPRLAAVRQVYGLAHHVPVDYNVSPLGRFDPAMVVQARKRVAAAKESWSAVAGGELHRLTGLNEQFSLVGDSLKRLFPLGEAFAAELQMAASQTLSSGSAPPAPLAMEVATSLLYVEAALEDADFDNPAQAERVRRLADRLGSVREGKAPDPLEPWMEELYRRVSDRQTMGSVVQELRASLSEAEKQIDQFFRKPEDREVLIPVPNQLAAMRGVLSVLGMDQATAALLRMRDEVEGLVQTEIDPQRIAQTGLFDRLAGNLGALGFLIDMLSVQPQMAKSLFVFDPRTGTLDPVMGRGPSHRQMSTPTPVEPRLIEQAQQLAFNAARPDVPVSDVARDLERLSQEASVADQSALVEKVERSREALAKADEADDREGVASVRGELTDVLVDFVSSTSEPMGLDSSLAPVRAATVSAPVPPSATAELAEDDEMREVFLEEAREVLHDAGVATDDLAHAPSDLALLTTVRRAFHTLKGSSRMVGLKEFGEAAWACEQMYNTQLADHRAAGPELIDFTKGVLARLSDWVADIAAHRDAARTGSAIKAAAQRLAAGQPALPLVTAPAPLSEAEALSAFGFSLPPDLPTAEALELPAAQAAPAASAPEVAFELDLSALDGVAAAAPAVAAPSATAIDFDLHALDEPFDAQATQPLPLSEMPASAAAPVDLAFDLIDLDLGSEAANQPLAETIEPSAAQPFQDSADLPLDIGDAASAPAEDENVKVVGTLRIGIPLFNIYLNEADELSRRLTTEVAEWAMELHRPIGETPIALAHSLAGSSATVGFNDLSHLARLLEHAQMRSQSIGYGTPEEARLFVDAAEEVRRLLHQFAAGFLKEPAPELLARLAEHEIESARRLEAATAAADLPPATGMGELDEAPELERIDLSESPDAQPEAEQPAATVPSSHAPFFETSGLSVSSFGALDTRVDALGVAELKPLAELPTASARSAERELAIEGTEDIDAVDAVDAELFPIFEEEGQDLLPQLSSRLRDWAKRPGETSHAASCMRTLHTLKGGARLAGAMRLGEMAHRLETRIEQILGNPPIVAADVEQLQMRGDALSQVFEALRARDAQAYEEASAAVVAAPVAAPVAAAPVSVPEPLIVAPAPETEVPVAASASEPEPAAAPAAPVDLASATELPPIDWSRFALGGVTSRVVADKSQSASQSAVRVRAPLLDRLVNQAGEVSITRSRIESEVGQIKGSLVDLTENLERLRQQLRDIELQAETQMSSRLEAAKAMSQSFDPLEFDRFTRFQELTRMMAESVNDVATVQRTLQRSLDSTEDELASQARLTRDLQDDLLRTRMVEFEGQSDRLYRVVRQAAKETGKQVRLDIVGGSIEVDRGVLDRMTGSFEHLLRNSVTHGIENPDARTAQGKDAAGAILVSLTQEGNEVGIEFRDDGKGLDLDRIRAKGLAMGLIQPDQAVSDADLANLIFTPGFTTAESVTELAGRGVGMDVVRSEVNAMGGRIETATAPGQGTSFKLVLPLTTAVTQVVMLRCGDATVAVPSTLIEIVRRATPAEIEQAYAGGGYPLGDRVLPFFWLGSLLQTSPAPTEAIGRTRPVVVVRSAQQRVALHVDEVLGNQEVVVKNLGPQLSRLPGLAGMTLLASGAVALIYNPVALATLYGDAARAATAAALNAMRGGAPAMPQAAQEPKVAAAPLVLVVDDSLTVRRVTQRLLVREGYRVVLAKDGMDALERLAEERPSIVLSDIEMPRMDGFDLVRNIRGDARLRDLPVIMITSRIAQKHRDYAAELGVDHYLGKPYSEEDLLALIGRYTAAVTTA
ncbi:Hpt domain-containing protein [Rhizobacter sp. AJA081-3]|uniref:hybrid sensor histidine kinase/response regulator n=1 Tax=Rhizobacter sp. AJA081-3 TaxID=2753607 RepID=UPI001ADFDB27|nr:Hpt domain-containing protein [Rhizobacter sp. AJA081-3]QTN24185.1 Hpt domain-containing protein [Rhizobacter sp. AJA081-3]